ncbi:MAG: adenine phosphoribosyltransferase [Verrucomicrobiales bacterium]|nr:adenine phosphoribosyltransferase [Verrucomicrobiales bacterium]
MKDTDLQKLEEGIRDVQDFPKPGILFKDITPVLSDGNLFRLAIDGFIETAREEKVSKIIGIDARGFIFGAAVADRLGIGFVPIRKKGKLPWQCEAIAYKLEYGEAEVEVHRDAIAPGEKVMMDEDLLATGGTAAAALELVQKLGGDVICATFLIELEFLDGRKNLPDDVRVESLLTY